jgi:hypothetical protein
MLMVLNVNGALGSRHIEEVLRRVLDDEEFMASSAHALFATMMYAMLEFPDWPARLESLWSAHRGHPIVEQLARSWALMSYRRGSMSDGTRKALERFLIDAYTQGVSGVGQRQQARSEVSQKLRQLRSDAQRLSSGTQSIEVELLDSEPSDEIPGTFPTDASVPPGPPSEVAS